MPVHPKNPTLLNNSNSKPYTGESWVAVKDAARHMGVTQSTIERYVQQDPTFPSHIFGGPDQRGNRRYRLSEIDAWILNQNKKAYVHKGRRATMLPSAQQQQQEAGL